MAKLYGLDAALVYAYLSWRDENFGSTTITLDELLKRYPYMGKQRLRSALNRLLRGHGEELPIITRSQQRGMLHYTYRMIGKYNPDFNLPDDVSHGARFCFEVEFTMIHGIVPAIIHHNLAHWIIENWKKQESLEDANKKATHYITPGKWAERHYYLTRWTVERGFKHLIDTKEIILCGRKGGRIPVWSLPKSTLDRLLDVTAETYFPESVLQQDMRQCTDVKVLNDIDV